MVFPVPVSGKLATFDQTRNILKLLATPPGLEPGTFSLEGYEETL